MKSGVMERRGGHTRPRSGKPNEKTCSFCKSKVHKSITNCDKLKALGRRLKKSELSNFRNNDLGPRSAYIYIDRAAMKELVTKEKPVLNTLPPATKWLVVHRMHNMSGTAHSQMPLCTRSQQELGVEVTCYDDFGEILAGQAPNAPNFERRVAKHSAVCDWIAVRCSNSAGKGSSRLITDMGE